MSNKPQDRPILITLIAIVYLLGALILIVGGIGIIGIGDAFMDELIEHNPDLDFLEGSSLVAGLIVLVIGAVSAAISYGFFKGWSIIWYVTFILNIIGLVFSALGIITGNLGSVFTALVQIVILYYLCRPKVKMFFLGRA